MNELQNFNFNNLPVRTVLIENEPWFVAKDV
ncbi:phage repressor protein/antirepressor Ant, partial [Lactococcus lactis]|nr:phage repressor protein/antirepressor Ant [Lactococcus lactis]MCT3099618.1 phage repressor protein/antirepressor Ant [Lactococcus lactis]